MHLIFEEKYKKEENGLRCVSDDTTRMERSLSEISDETMDTHWHASEIQVHPAQYDEQTHRKPVSFRVYTDAAAAATAVAVTDRDGDMMAIATPPLTKSTHPRSIEDTRVRSSRLPSLRCPTCLARLRNPLDREHPSPSAFPSHALPERCSQTRPCQLLHHFFTLTVPSDDPVTTFAPSNMYTAVLT